MATNITLLHYNNYFNRIVKKAGSVQQSYTALDSNYKQINSINFVPGDGIYTTVVVGTSDISKMDYDYLIVWNSSNNAISSRWFIMEDHRTRDGQYELSLRRDVIADNYETVKEAPVYVEKAYIKETTNPLLFNKEGLEVNQIKQTEYPIKDETQSGWIVGYVPRDAFKTLTIVDSDVYIPATPDITVNGITNWTYWKNVRNLNQNGKYLLDTPTTNYVRFRNKARYSRTVYSSGTTTYFATRYVYFPTNQTLNQYNAYVSTQQSDSQSGQPAIGALPTWYEGWTPQEFVGATAQSASAATGYFGTSAVPTIVQNLYTNTTFVSHLNWFLGEQSALELGSTAGLRGTDEKVIFDSATNIYYRIKVKSRTPTEYYTAATSTTAGYNVINDINNNMVKADLVSWSYTYTGNLSSGDVEVKPGNTEYYIELEQLAYSLRVNIDYNRSHLEDAPYDMFCIPYSDTLQLYDGATTFTCKKNVALTMATAIGAKAGSANVYDVQLLPFCPSREAIIASANPSVTLNISGVSYDLIQFWNGSSMTTKHSAVIWCSKSTFDFERTMSQIGATAITSLDLSTTENIKLSNECDLFRLVSGNYNGIFEFSPAKSGGVSGIKVECNYKPWNPYLHILPKLSGLYGDNFTNIDDARGLICGGDFSITQLNSEWANYQLNNKTYQEMFDRQIQNLDINNSIAMQQAQFQSVAGAFGGTSSGAVSGALTGAKVGGGYGAIAGGIIGGVAGGGLGIAGGVLDIQNLEKLQGEQRSYAIDMFNYNLQNIQAIPYSISKTTALTYNTRIWPFIEYYTCTVTEKQALRDKIKYNGMTVMAIGKLSDYETLSGEKKFFIGELIRLPDIASDNHMANEIYKEINKGVYI